MTIERDEEQLRVYGSDENDYGLAKLHSVLIEVLDAFHEICVDNDIKYSLHGGALLGAVRNGRLIPWDDDIDVMMTRAYYEKFRSAITVSQCGAVLDETTIWFPRFVKFFDGEPAYVDILIWDYITDNKIGQFIKYNLLRAIQGMMKTDVDYSKFGIGYRALLGITGAVGKLFSSSQKVAAYNRLAQHLVGKKHLIHRANDAYHWISHTFNPSCMEEYIDIELEGKKYYATADYHRILCDSYGADYLTPPPLAERVPLHDKFRNELEMGDTSAISL